MNLNVLQDANDGKCLKVDMAILFVHTSSMLLRKSCKHNKKNYDMSCQVLGFANKQLFSGCINIKLCWNSKSGKVFLYFHKETDMPF